MTRSITAICIVAAAALFFLLMFMIPQTAYTQPTFNSQTGVDDRPCEVLAEIAGAVMSARQSGMPMSEVWNQIRSVKLYEAIVIAAYDVPIQSTLILKQAAVDEFNDYIFSTCVRTLYFDAQ
jgi:hypothetical protein